MQPTLSERGSGNATPGFAPTEAGHSGTSSCATSRRPGCTRQPLRNQRSAHCRSGTPKCGKSWGIVPDAVVGHSVGEIAAAHVAGALDGEQAIRVIVQRGRCMDRASSRGGMVALGCSLDEAREAIREHSGEITVGAHNSPSSVTLSGDLVALEEIQKVFDGRGYFTKRLPVNYAFHSARMEPARKDLVEALRALEPDQPQIPFVSTVTGQPIDGARLDGEYWWRNIRQPVPLSRRGGLARGQRPRHVRRARPASDSWRICFGNPRRTGRPGVGITDVAARRERSSRHVELRGSAVHARWRGRSRMLQGGRSEDLKPASDASCRRRLGRPSCDRRLHHNVSHMRRDDPLVLRMKLHMQADPDPAHLQATAAEARPAQARTSPFGEKTPHPGRTPLAGTVEGS